MVVTDKYLNLVITIRLGGKDVLSIECISLCLYLWPKQSYDQQWVMKPHTRKQCSGAGMPWSQAGSYHHPLSTNQLINNQTINWIISPFTDEHITSLLEKNKYVAKNKWKPNDNGIALLLFSLFHFKQFKGLNLIIH